MPRLARLGSRIRRQLILPAFFRFVQPSRRLAYLEVLESTQFRSLERNREEQARRLFRLLKDATDHVPYYRETARALGIKVREDRVFDDLRRFPALSRDTLQQRLSDLCPDPSSARRNYSGGSTGQPVTFYQSAEYKDWARAAKLLFSSWAGCGPGDRVLKYWGSERDVLGLRSGLRGVGGDWLHNRKVVDSFCVTEKRVMDLVRVVERWRPRLIVAYAEPMAEAARILLRSGRAVDYSGGIITSAGTLFPDFRAWIEEAFGVPVHNRYGTREVGDLACECERHRGLHVSMLTHFVEVVNRDREPCKPGETGEMLVTSLVNRAMPFIRYRIGDVATRAKEGCDCGRGLEVLAAVEGRTTSFVRIADGRAISPEFFIHAIGVMHNDDDAIRKFQVLQVSRSELLVRLVFLGDAASRKDTLSRIDHTLHAALGTDVEIAYEEVKDIPPSPSGKYLYVISQVEDG